MAGGMLTQLASWRWVLFINVPIGDRPADRHRRVALPETARESRTGSISPAR